MLLRPQYALVSNKALKSPVMASYNFQYGVYIISINSRFTRGYLKWRVPPDCYPPYTIHPPDLPTTNAPNKARCTHK